ncbi:MAG: TonB-dependent receptor [Campylobacterales bacterium]|nr:TonB-dependent receptor [Campylobacterales bacterium]
MKKITTLSIIAACALSAAEVQLAPIGVEATVMTDVAQKAQTSADVAQALSDAVPSIDMSRRSGIANDVYIRGQKRDNISVEVDGTKVCGACPNRMDPPVSHIVANQIETIEVIEGPYDVETFGTLSGGLKITTKKPSAEEQGEINLGFGSFGYKKFGANGSGGNDILRVSATVSTETSDQYRDGDGNTLTEQLANFKLLTGAGNPYAPAYKDEPAYTKKSAMVKAFVKTLENQELRLSVTANRSDGVLYANSSMDARYDYSNIYSIEYNIDDISDIYKNINLQYYYSDVDHPMDTMYRVNGTLNYSTNQLKTTMQGIKLKNSFNLQGHEILVGLDGSRRTWEGQSYMTNVATGTVSGISDSIPLTTTDNSAIFAKLLKSFGKFDVELGTRYDYTTIRTKDATLNKDFNALNANLITSYYLDSSSKLFLALGQASRVPDARELYWFGMGIQNNPDLDQTTNQEIDLGYETDNESFKLKAKAFYSMLHNYIYLRPTGASPAYEFVNLDATVYGAELAASIYMGDAWTLDMGAAYKVGEKNSPAANESKNLADMTPLNGNVALNYEYANNSLATLEVQASQKWDKIDDAAGEQEIDAWSILNAKLKHAVNKKFDITLGVNNIFDETYAVSNTYIDLKLIGNAPIMVLNEPGRYVYTNLDFKF